MCVVVYVAFNRLRALERCMTTTDNTYIVMAFIVFYRENMQNRTEKYC